MIRKLPEIDGISFSILAVSPDLTTSSIENNEQLVTIIVEVLLCIANTMMTSDEAVVKFSRRRYTAPRNIHI